MGYKYRDDRGQEHEIPGDRIRKIWTEEGQEHDVAGHGLSHGLSDEADVEGHGQQFPLPDGGTVDLSQITKIRFTDDDGNEQEVEGHAYRGGW
jgi:hypothetical protein